MNGEPGTGHRRPGGRLALPPLPPLLRGGSAAGALLVLAAVVLVVVAPPGPGHSAPSARGSTVPVTRTELGCPGAGGTFGVAVAPGGDDNGDVEVGGGRGLPLAPGHSTQVDGSSDGLDVRASDDLARGLFAWRADTGRRTAVSECPAPRARWWFTGAGTALGHESLLTVANLDAAPAVVDVRVLSSDGEVDVSDVGGRGITIAPGASVALRLSDLAPAEQDLSVAVQASRGRVVAAVRDQLAARPGATPGLEWLPGQDEPSRSLTLVGVGAHATHRTLLVGNPGDSEAVVRVEVEGPVGRYVPAGAGQTSVPPGSVVPVDLGSNLEARGVAVRVLASVPVVAAVRSVSVSGDTSYAGPATALQAAAAAPVVGATSVQLTAGPDLARAVVTAYDRAGRSLRSQTLTMAASSTRRPWRVPDSASYVVVRPTTGLVRGAMVFGAGSAMPLRDLPLTVRVPAVWPDYSAS